MSMKMNELPESLRPYEKCVKRGANALDDAELLSVILRSGTREKNVLETSRELLIRAGGSLAGLYDISEKDFTTVPGIGRIKAMQLECLKVLCSRIVQSGRKEKMLFDRPERIADYYMEEMRLYREERLKLLLLNARLRLLSDVEMAKGSANAAMIPVREILRRALLDDAVFMVLLHNHPSGDPEPSAEDIRSTAEVASGARSVGIRLVDHLILGDGRFVSLRERGVLDDFS